MFESKVKMFLVEIGMEGVNEKWTESKTQMNKNIEMLIS